MGFYDAKGYWREYGEGFYDFNGDWVSPGGAYHDAKGYLRSPGDGFYDAKGNYVLPGEPFYDIKGERHSPRFWNQKFENRLLSMNLESLIVFCCYYHLLFCGCSRPFLFRK